ncbi:MAG: hypothetical protein GX882_05030 [Methanomicrobiales archaeon]|nr:hypothetical protein [Methanomicrobiales archaeon]
METGDLSATAGFWRVRSPGKPGSRGGTEQSSALAGIRQKTPATGKAALNPGEAAPGMASRNPSPGAMSITAAGRGSMYGDS